MPLCSSLHCLSPECSSVYNCNISLPSPSSLDTHAHLDLKVLVQGHLVSVSPTFFWQFRLDGAVLAPKSRLTLPWDQFLLRSLTLFSCDASSAEEFPVHYTWGGATIMPPPHSFVHPWLHGHQGKADHPNPLARSTWTPQVKEFGRGSLPTAFLL